jgi:hypothetical protein
MFTSTTFCMNLIFAWRTSFATDSLEFHLGKLRTRHMTLPLAILVRGASAVTCCWCFSELLSAYLDHTVVYTDGSFVQVSTCSAFIYDEQVFSYHLLNFNRVFTAKLYAVYQALLFIWCQPQQCHLIFTDSLSAL